MAFLSHVRKLAATTTFAPSVSPLRRCVHLSCTLLTGQGKALPTLTLFTKNNCSLCDDAKEVLKKYDGRFVLEEVYITEPEHQEYFTKYRYDIPVFHFNGEFLMRHRVNESLFKKKLSEYEGLKD